MTFKEIFYYVWIHACKYKRFIFTLILLMLINNTLGIAMNIVNQITFDQVFYNRNVDFLLGFMIYVIAICFMVSLFLGIVNKYLSIKLYSQVVADLRLKYHEDILKSDILLLNDKKGDEIFWAVFKFDRRFLI